MWMRETVDERWKEMWVMRENCEDIYVPRWMELNYHLNLKVALATPLPLSPSLPPPPSPRLANQAIHFVLALGSLTSKALRASSIETPIEPALCLLHKSPSIHPSPPPSPLPVLSVSLLYFCCIKSLESQKDHPSIPALLCL